MKLIKPTRRKLLLAGAVLIASPAIVRAGSMTLLGAGGVGAGGTGPTLNQTDMKAVSGSISGVSDYTFNAVSIGMATATRVVVVSVEAYLGGSVLDFSAITVGTTPLAKIDSLGTSTIEPTAIWYGVVGVGEGATANINIAWGSNIYGGDMCIAVDVLDGVNPTPTTHIANLITVTGSTTYTSSQALTIPTSGFGVIFMHGTTASSPNWTTDNTDTTHQYSNIGHFSTPGSLTPSFTGGAYNHAGIVGATWGP